MARPLQKISESLRGGKGTGWTIRAAINSFGNYYFEHLVWKRFQKDLKAGKFDLVHRLIPLSPTAPSPIAAKLKRIGVPFIIGPLNGGLPWPREFDGARRKEREWLSYVRGAYKLLPGYHATRRHASVIIAGSQATLSQIPKRYQHKCIYVPENAIDPARFTLTPTRHASLPLRIVFVGRLVPYKGPDMLLEAAEPLLKTGQIKLIILGDGPLMPQLRDQITQRDIPGVDLPGWIPHEQLQQHLAESDLFGFPSIREFGGAVVLEAMAMGCVPIVVNYGGPGELVTDATGIRIPMGTREQLIQRFRQALVNILADIGSIDHMRAACRARVFEQFTWQAKARKIVDIYQQTITINQVQRNSNIIASASTSL